MNTPCDIRIGTSGYSYTEWAAAGFYPPDTPSGRMLPLYAEHFPVTELNYTWYQMPRAEAIARTCQHVREGFGFTAKLTRTLTHEIDPDGWRSQASRYREGIAPLIQSGRLRAVLIQLPPTFVRSVDNRIYLAALLDELGDLPLAIEFRHASWVSERVVAELERRRVTLVSVDIPTLPGLFPPLDLITNPALFYIRFHGRNARGWRSGNMQHQFDYDYTEAELREWAERRIFKMAGLARSGVIFFNNHVRAQAPKNAETLAGILAAAGLMEKDAWNAPSST